MTVTTQANGNKITSQGIEKHENGNTIISYEKFYYEDGEEYTGKNYRPCPKCGKIPTQDGHDACLGTLPGVKYACCGHGVSGYITFVNGVTIRFDNLSIDKSKI